MDVSDYEDVLWRLLPPGPAWSRDNADLAAFVKVGARRLAAVDAAAARLLDEGNPYKTLAMLPDWEADFGLPDSCSAATPTLAERRATLVARLTDAGGVRIPRFVQIAAALGYPGASAKRFAAHTCEFSCEAPLYSEDWRFTWQLNVPATANAIDGTCESGVEDPLSAWGNTQLSCILARECPQPSTVLISYGA
ncbi:YmfQ family protein [Vogesella sp. GCM10023246]|uniref:Phage tail protein n=1 Tax=Vogesella oryzagri TaxID=3160864 RepID=A0ABV1M081_9NEIS